MATYKIKSGDTLGSIARRYNTTVSKLARDNNISNPDRIYAGNTITVPGGGGGGGSSGPSDEERLAYGFATSFLNKNKDVRNLVDKAIDKQWTQQRFIDELRSTSWWKKRSDAEKRYEVMRAENPEQISREVDQASSQVSNLAARLGVYLSGSQRDNIATAWVRQGLTEDEVRDMVGRKYTFKSRGNARQRGTVGIAGQARAQLDELGRNYGLRWGRKFLTGAARQVARGRRQVSDYESYAREQAARTYKAIAPDIKEGRTVRDILEPYLAHAAQELGMSPSIMNTTHSKWIAPVSGDHQWTMDEWTRELRSNTRYGYNESRNGRREAAIYSAELMESLGAR